MWEPSSSPMGVSSEIGCCAIFLVVRTFSTEISMRLAISSAVGSRPSSCTKSRCVRTSLLIVVDHVHRDADGARLIGDGAGDGLANPPGGVGGELVSAAPVELVDALHEADIALLNQIEELQAVISVFLGDGDNQAKVRLRQLLLRLSGFRLSLAGLS